MIRCEALLPDPLSATLPACLRDPAARGLTPALTLFLSASVGVIFLNVPAPQTLIGVIGPDIGLAPALYGLVATAPLLGYALGLFLLIPLADLLENRALITRTLAAAVVLAGITAVVQGAGPLLALLFLLGLASSAVQMIVPMAASMAAPDHRGRVVGDIMSGLMVGILLSRPVASLVEHAFGWRVFYTLSAVALAAITIGLRSLLPQRRPCAATTYVRLVGSLATLVRTEPVLRRRAITAALGMGAFTAFWTAIALELSGPRFHLDQTGIAIFALAGAGGAVIAPVAGRAGDHGWTRKGTVLAHAVMVGAFAVALLGHHLGAGMPWLGILTLAVAAIALDMGVIGDQTFGRRAVNLLDPDARARLNGLFVGLFFIGGSIGTTLTGLVWVQAGWPGACALGAGFAVAALLTDLLPARD